MSRPRSSTPERTCKGAVGAPVLRLSRSADHLLGDQHALFTDLENSDAIGAQTELAHALAQVAGAIAGTIVRVDERVEVNRHHALGAQERKSVERFHAIHVHAAHEVAWFGWAYRQEGQREAGETGARALKLSSSNAGSAPKYTDRPWYSNTAPVNPRRFQALSSPQRPPTRR